MERIQGHQAPRAALDDQRAAEAIVYREVAAQTLDETARRTSDQVCQLETN
jgi:hypothetical protein